MCDPTHLYGWHDSFIYIPLFFAYAWHDVLIYVIWPIRPRDMSHSYACHVRVPLIVHVCAMTHSYILLFLAYAWHDVLIYVLQGGEDPQDALSLLVIFRKRALQLVALLWKMTCNLKFPMSLLHPVWLIRLCDTTHSCVPWLIRTCTMTHSYMWHDSFVCVPESIRLCAMTHCSVWRDSCLT